MSRCVSSQFALAEDFEVKCWVFSEELVFPQRIYIAAPSEARQKHYPSRNPGKEKLHML
jgi:hypothetical protein